MKKVLIIKNNNKVKKIHDLAQESYDQKIKRYYNLGDSVLNEQEFFKLKKEFNDKDYDHKAIVLMITYDNMQQKNIKDVFIGDEVIINDNNGIQYNMKIHLTSEYHERVISSIIDKIDLDIVSDFEYGQYVMMSDMESLYDELKERIMAREKNILNSINKNELKTDVEYKLSKFAQKDEQSIRIYQSESVGENRTEFQRDRERVVNCKAFRRLVDKAQIFGSEKGDYYRTRMTHTLEVNQIAKAIAYALRLNLDLTEAIALGHDLGHTPFGHQGERTLDEILCGKIDVGLNTPKEMLNKRCYGGFKHNYQSAKILTQIEEKYKEFPGLNVSVQVVEGVLKHTRLRSEINIEDFLTRKYIEKINIGSEDNQICCSLEGQVVAIADEIAQRGHDVDDALTSGVITINEFKDRLKIAKCKDLFNKINNEIKDINCSKRLIIDKKELCISRIVTVIINYFIQETIKYSLNLVKLNESNDTISSVKNISMVKFPPEVESVNSYLENVVQKKVICNNEVARADYNANVIIQNLFSKYYKYPRLLHSGTIHRIFIETLSHSNKAVSDSAINLSDGSIKLVNKEIEEITTGDIDKKIVYDYLHNIDNSRNEKEIIIFEKRRILIRAIVDYIAGMTDGYALKEYERLK